MADTHETIAEIIAEMRGMGNYQRYSGDHARVLANRLEAAHKRELSKNVSKNGADFGQLGDCAKLREALALIATIEFPHNFQNERFDIADACQDLTNAIKTASAALAAPPRNCDRFATADEAIGAYRQTHKHMVVNVFLDWLFAPATEKEGGAK